MVSLFAQNAPAVPSYDIVYSALSELRETFHQLGHLDDSNAKLDEVAKLFASYLAFKTGQIDGFPSSGSISLVAELRDAFRKTAGLPQYEVVPGGTVFGVQPDLAIRPGDERVAAEMVNLVRSGIDLAFENRINGHPFDILNDAFGHFVRDNFRGNIEDAQYMTPPEVTSFMSGILLHDLLLDGVSSDASPSWTIVDPACGLSSFLSAFCQCARSEGRPSLKHINLWGQDKIERMIRLSIINLQLFGVDKYSITLGNSLERESPLDSLNGKVDAVLTNPPFGARFTQEYLANKCKDNTPFFSALRRFSGAISSEALFVDRSLALLRDGGRLLIVVPDGVVSSRGMSALLRGHLHNTTTLRAVVELPSTTFAQAGTRTKTVVLYLQKGRTSHLESTFMAVSNNLGFQVSSRKGVQVKVPNGQNDLPAILDAYKEFRHSGEAFVRNRSVSAPPMAVVPESTVVRGNWTPRYHSATSVNGAGGEYAEDFELVPLSDLVIFYSHRRKMEHWREGCAFISVLHILGEGLLNLSEAKSYAPKTPGLPVLPGEIVMSRINPRISRVCVIPDVGVKLLCSSEFEVMRAKDAIDPYLIAYLLQTEAVKNQVISLVSGTSASHSRIRTVDLGQVLLPMAKRGSKIAANFDELVADYKRVLNSLAKYSMELIELRMKESGLFL